MPNTKNHLELLAIPVAAAALLGGLVARNVLRVNNLESKPGTTLVKTTETDLAANGHYGGTVTKLVPKTITSSHSNRYP